MMNGDIQRATTIINPTRSSKPNFKEFVFLQITDINNYIKLKVTAIIFIIMVINILIDDCITN